MKLQRYVFFVLLLSTKLFGQEVANIRSLGGRPTDLNVLSKMSIATPQPGAVGGIPPAHRMDKDCPPVSNQCNIGSCTSQATAYGLCGILAKKQDRSFLFSPMYMHYFIKVVEHTATCNDCSCWGAAIGNALDYLIDNGIPSLDHWQPDQCDINSCNIEPTSSPSEFRLSSKKPLFYTGFPCRPGYRTDIMRYYLALDYPVPFSMDIDSSFWIGWAFNNPKDLWQSFYKHSIGRHTMLAVGYDDTREAFLVMNSWGTSDWNTVRNDRTDDAKPGYCWISYNIMENYCYEAFIANENTTGYSVSVSDLAKANSSPPEKVKSVNNDIDFFVTDRYQQYDSVRFIPIQINKKKDEATIAIYTISNDTPLFYAAFNTKPNQIDRFKIDGREFIFKSLYIEPWRKYLGIFNGEMALFYQIKIE